MIPPNYQWGVYIEEKQGFNPVSIMFYVTQLYADAFAYLETRIHLRHKKRRLYVKQLGSKYRHYQYDERFDAALQMDTDTDSDAYYGEPVGDAKTFVMLKRDSGVGKWRGRVRL